MLDALSARAFSAISSERLPYPYPKNVEAWPKLLHILAETAQRAEFPTPVFQFPVRLHGSRPFLYKTDQAQAARICCVDGRHTSICIRHYLGQTPKGILSAYWPLSMQLLLDYPESEI